MQSPRPASTRVHLWIEGRVQGVMFRDSAREIAEELGLAGWIRNLPDGRVEVVIEGPPEDVGEMVDWCRHGPPGAYVRDVNMVPEPPLGAANRFEIRPTEPVRRW